MFQLQVFKELAAYGEGMPPDFNPGKDVPVAEGEIIVGELPADVLQLIWARNNIADKANAMAMEHAATCKQDNKCASFHKKHDRLKLFHKVLEELAWEAIHDAFGAETFAMHEAVGYRVGPDGTTVAVKISRNPSMDADKALDGFIGAMYAGRHGGVVQMRTIRIG